MGRPSTLTKVSILRLARPGSPSLTSIAHRMKASTTLLSEFELGHEPMSPEMIGKYAEAVGSTPREVMVRYLLTALEWHRSMVRELSDRLRTEGAPPPQPPRRRSK